MKKILYLIFLIPQFLLAQCVIDKQIDSLYYYHPELHPSINPSHLLLKQFTIDFAATISDRSVDEIVIPVVYHIVHDNGDENISEEQIIESLLQVNEDFNALNPELPGVHDSFQSLISDVGITFKLAEFNPNGEPTTGINRIQSDLTYNGGNIALKELVQWPPDQYLNIWVVYSSDGSNGSAFAFYPADVVGSGSIYDGIVASYWSVGRTGTAISSHYKILSHEIGHWANLMHTWGDGSSNQSASGCSFDDGVDDTPNTIGNSGCILEAVSCESQDNVQNYMDYSNCSAMFTEGQKTRMLAALYSSVGNRDDIWSDENLEQVFIQQDILPRIVYSSGNYNEHSGNDGTVEDTIAIQLLDLSFSSIGMLEQGVDYSTLNLPEGLDLNIQLIDSTNAIIVMQGQVSEHSLVNSVNNIEIHFTSNPFNSVVLDEIYNPSKTNVSLTFIDPYSIVFVDKVNDLHNLLEGTNWNWFSYGVGSADFGLWTYDKDNFKLEIYSNAGVCYNGTRNLIPFESGELIGPANTFTYYDGYPSQLDIYNEDYTEWAGKIAYAGVTFQLSGNQHYGWLRIKVNNDASEAWVMDMAYNEAPNQPIITGEVQTPVISTSQNVFYESNDNDGSIRSIRRFDLHGSEFVDFESTPINNGFSITNLPSGLSAILNRVDSTSIQIELTGNAISHNASLIPIIITIDQSLINGYLPNNLILESSVKFEDAYQVVYQDVDDFTVSSNGDDWHWFSIGLTDYGLWYNNDHLRIETYGKSLASIPNTELVSSIGFGEQIQENLTWEYSAYCYECQPIVYSSNYTSWAGDTAYVGLKIPYQENFHYGWLRLKVTEDGSAMTLLDYAYNLAPNLPIATSQSGCTDTIAFNYNENANVDNGSCVAVVLGCVDELSFNYNPEANTEDDSCIAVVNGCMDDLALNYNPEANTDNNGLCFFDYDILGCIDSLANNYSDIVTYDDGSCQYPGLTLNPVPTELCLGDTVIISWSGGNPNVDIYISLTNVSTNTSTGQNDIVANTGEYIWIIENIPPGPGDIYKFYIQDYPWPPSSWSHGSHFTICPIYGCTNIDAFNYNPSATLDDETCLGDILGCTNIDACNYDEDAIQSDNSCEFPIEGYDCFGECLYDGNSDGICEDVYYGCLDSLANNYNVNANEDDGSCQYPGLSLNPVPTELCLGDTVIISWTGGNPYDDVKVKLTNVTTWTSAGQIDIVANTGEYIWVVQNLPPGPGDTYDFYIQEYPGPPSSSSHGSHFTICPIYGCTNIEALNYNPNATLDDGTCFGDIFGCTNPISDNYNPEASIDDGLCEFTSQADGYCLELSPLQEYENTNVTNITSVGDTIYYSGTFSGVLDFGTFTLVAQSTQDVFIVKVLNCEVLWARQLTGYSLSNSSLLATHEYVLIGGNYSSDISFFEDSTIQNIQHVGGGDGYVLKLNSVGEYLWHTKVVGESNEGIQDIAIDNQDNVYISGYYNGCCPSSFTASISSSNGTNITINAPEGYYGSGFVSKLDVQGNPLWAFEAWARDIAITNIEIYNEHLYLSGDFRTWNSGSSGLINDVNGTSNDIFNPGIGLSFLAQYSTDGVYNWNVSIGNQGDVVARTTTITDLMLTNSGDPIVCGFYSNGISTFYGTNGNNLTLPVATSRDGFIAKYKSEGVVSWVTGWGGDGDQSPSSMGVNSMNNIYIGGTFSEIMNEVNSEGEEDIFLFEMNDMGDEIETNYYGSSQQDVLNDLVAYQNDVAFCGVISPGVELDNVIAQGGGFVYIPSVIINQLIDFPTGWFTFSTYMNPDNIGIESVLNPIIDDLIIVKDNLGQAYLPLWDFNGIGDIILGQGYQIKLSNSASITVEGTYLLPEENPITLTAGWNLIGYLRLEGSNSDSVLIDIVSAANLIIAKDFEGNAYLPEYDFNGIGDMVPGQGYKLKVNEDDELTYLPNDD